MGLELLTDKELSTTTGVPVATWRYWRANGTGPPWHKLGRSVRYQLSEVEQWLQETRVEPQPPR